MSGFLPAPWLPARPPREIPQPMLAPPEVAYLPRDPGSMPESVACVRCGRRAMHCWGVATGRDDHTCCIHWMLSSGEEPDAGHPECVLAHEVLLGEQPLEVLNDVLAGRRAA